MIWDCRWLEYVAWDLKAWLVIRHGLHVLVFIHQCYHYSLGETSTIVMGQSIHWDRRFRRIHFRYRIRNTYGVDGGFTISCSMRLLYRKADAVVSQQVAVVLQFHDSEFVLSNRLLYYCHGHACFLFGIVVVDARSTRDLGVNVVDSRAKPAKCTVRKNTLHPSGRTSLGLLSQSA